MRAVLKSAALNLALSAMLLRALLPAGWMPNPQAAASASPFAICTIGGPVQPKPAHGTDRAHAAPCIFAAAAPLSPPAAILDAPAPLAVSFAAFATRHETLARIDQYRSFSPRAPPAFA